MYCQPGQRFWPCFVKRERSHLPLFKEQPHSQRTWLRYWPFLILMAAKQNTLFIYLTWVGVMHSFKWDNIAYQCIFCLDKFMVLRENMAADERIYKKPLNNSMNLLFWKSWRAAAVARHMLLVLKFTVFSSSIPTWSKSDSKLLLEIIHSQPHISSHQLRELLASPVSKYHWKQSKIIGFTSVAKAQTESSFTSFESQQLALLQLNHFWINEHITNVNPCGSLSLKHPDLGLKKQTFNEIIIQVNPWFQDKIFTRQGWGLLMNQHLGIQVINVHFLEIWLELN